MDHHWHAAVQRVCPTVGPMLASNDDVDVVEVIEISVAVVADVSIGIFVRKKIDDTVILAGFFWFSMQCALWICTSNMHAKLS